MNVTDQISNEINIKKDVPNFGAGDTITVYYKIREGNKERIQFFKGDVIQRRGSRSTETFTIRKISSGIGVEKIFPINSPLIDKISFHSKILQSAKTLPIKSFAIIILWLVFAKLPSSVLSICNKE